MKRNGKRVNVKYGSTYCANLRKNGICKEPFSCLKKSPYRTRFFLTMSETSELFPDLVECSALRTLSKAVRDIHRMEIEEDQILV